MYKKITDEEYFKIDALSNSFLKNFDRSPAHAFTGIEKTPAMKKGSQIHDLILQPEKFYDEHKIIEKINRNTKEYKKIVEENPDKEIMFTEELDELLEIQNAVLKAKFEGVPLSLILCETLNEVYDTYEEMGEVIKGKVDAVDVENHIIFDLKKTDDASNFQKAINNYKYYRQAWLYKEIHFENYGKLPRFIFIAIEEKKPYGVRFYELNNDYMELGKIEVIKSIQEYKEWKARGSDKSECYSDETIKLDVPNWMRW